MSKDLRARIENVKKKFLNPNVKAAVLTSVMTVVPGVFSSCGNSAKITDNSENHPDKVVNMSTNPMDKIVTSLEDADRLALEKNMCQLESQGAFFIDYEHYTKTGNVAESIVYFTQAEMKQRNIQSIGTSPYDVSLARENHVVLTGDSAVDTANVNAAAGKITGSFNGLYQLNQYNMENLVLWGLAQKDNPEVREFCKNFVVKDVNIDKDERFVKFVNKWQKQPIGVLNSKTEERSSALACLNVTKSNFNKFSEQNPRMSELTQKEFLKNNYLKSSIHYKTLCNADFLSAVAAVCGYVHLPNGGDMPTILKRKDLSAANIAKKIITNESGKDKYGRECMTQAFDNIYNKGYPELECFCEWAAMTGREDLLKELQNGKKDVAIQKIAETQPKKDFSFTLFASADKFTRE